MLIQNTAEGGSNTTTVTIGNSGGASGTAWNNVTIGASGATITYSNTQELHGSLSYKITTSATADQAFLGWTTAMAPSTTMYLRAYYYFDSVPISYTRIGAHINSSFQIMGGFGTNSTGRLTVKNATNATILTSSLIMPAGQWVRFEFMTSSDATVGQMELKIFLDPISNTPDEVLTTTATQNTRGGNINTAIFGIDVATANASFYMDSIAVQDTGYVGPVPAYAAPWLTA